MTTAAAPFLSGTLLEWITAVATGVGVLVAIIAIAVTARQVRLTARQMRESAIREAHNSEAQTRPYVGADFMPGLAGSPSFDIIIANYGNTTARDVRLELVDAAFEEQSDGDPIAPALGRFFSAGFDLSPTASRRVFWRHPEDERADPPGAMGAPATGEIRMTYTWRPDDGSAPRHYEERLRYDLTEYLKLAPTPAYGAEAYGSSSDPTVQMRNAVHALRTVAQQIGELRR